MPLCCKQRRPSLCVSSKSIPRKTTPFERACCHCDCKNGASAIHGPQVELQTFSITGFPLKFKRERSDAPCVPVASAARVKFGAACPINGSDDAGVAFFAGVNRSVQSSASRPTLNRLTTIKMVILRLLLFLLLGAGSGVGA